MRKLVVRAVATLVTLGAVACSSSESANSADTGNATPGDDAGSQANGDAGSAEPTAHTAFDLAVACDDKVVDIYDDPGKLPKDLGAIIKCTKVRHMTADQLASQALLYGYEGTPLQSGTTVYKVLYRTERGDEAKSPGTSSALVYVPDQPRATKDGKLPIVVTSHGTKGQGQKCASSITEYDGYMNYPLVGAGGYAVIAPDLAGYANFGATGNPISAYADAADVGKSTLDGARALRKMFPESFNENVVVLGHSQGGGTALAALAMSEAYGCDGKLAGVVPYAPYWLSLAAWAAMPLLDFTTAKDELISSVAIWFLYGQSELHDGPGHGTDVFKAEKRSAVRQFVYNACYPQLSGVKQLGATMNDIYDPEFIASVSAHAKNGDACGDALCEKWKARFNAGRPHFEGATTKVPVLLALGGKDDIITPGRAACTVDRLKADGVSFDVCYKADKDHTAVVGATASYVNDWIAARTLGAPEPQGCGEAYEKPACGGTVANDWN